MPKKVKKDDIKKPIIYLDTCILRNCLAKRNEEDIILLEHVRKNKFDCITSVYTLLELFEISKDRQFFINSLVKRWIEVNTYLSERNNKNLRVDELNDIGEEIENILKNYDFIQFFNLEGNDDWNLLYEICGTSNLSLSDNIHLAQAYISGSTHLITRDAFFIKEGNKILSYNEIPKNELQVCLPKKILDLEFK